MKLARSLHKDYWILLLLCTFCFLSPNTTFAQVKDGIKLLEKQNYDGAFAAFQNDLNTENISVVAKYNMAKVFFTEDYSAYHIDSAYNYVKVAMEEQRKVPYDARKKLTKLDPTFNNMKKLKREVTKKAYEMADAKKTVTDYNHFLSFYEKADRTLESKMAKKRNALAFDEALQINTTSAYDDVLTKYRSSFKKKSSDLYNKLQKKHFEQYIRDNSWNSYDAFAEKYTYNVYVLDSFKTNFDRIRKTNSLKEYKGFVLVYPSSLYVKIAADSIGSNILKGNDMDELQYFIGQFPEHEMTGDVWMKYYESYVRKNGKESILRFKYDHPKFPHQDRLDKDLGKFDDGQEKKDLSKAKRENTFYGFKSFIQTYPLSKQLPEAIEGIYKVTVKDSIINEYQYFVESFPKHDRIDEMWDRYYELHKEERCLTTANPSLCLADFGKKYPNFPFKEKLAADVQIEGENLKKKREEKKREAAEKRFKGQGK